MATKQEYNMLLNENTKLKAERDDKEYISNKELQQKIKLKIVNIYHIKFKSLKK